MIKTGSKHGHADISFFRTGVVTANITRTTRSHIKGLGQFDLDPVDSGVDFLQEYKKKKKTETLSVLWRFISCFASTY